MPVFQLRANGQVHTVKARASPDGRADNLLGRVGLPYLIVRRATCHTEGTYAVSFCEAEPQRSA
jgi:hypothetical protein